MVIGRRSIVASIFVLAVAGCGEAVDPEILAAADKHVHLDMLGTKSTLNVGVTFGTVAYWVRNIVPSA